MDEAFFFIPVDQTFKEDCNSISVREMNSAGNLPSVSIQ